MIFIVSEIIGIVERSTTLFQLIWPNLPTTELLFNELMKPFVREYIICI